MKRLVISRTAAHEIVDIWKYIARDNLNAADKIRDELEAAMRLLCESPGLGHERDDVKAKAYRFWTVYPYLIVYFMRGDTLTVMRVLHGARNLRRISSRWHRQQ